MNRPLNIIGIVFGIFLTFGAGIYTGWHTARSSNALSNENTQGFQSTRAGERSPSTPKRNASFSFQIGGSSRDKSFSGKDAAEADAQIIEKRIQTMFENKERASRDLDFVLMIR
ncbi:MAG: hypothetical protein AB8D78_07715 [Akkermansiaceae bacterium]